MLSITLVSLLIHTFAMQAQQASEIVHATHYGESYNGSPMGCISPNGSRQYYDSNNPTILAVGPTRYAEWPCGTQLLITGPAGTIQVTRTDSCPGCSHNVIDLSELGNELVCGSPPHTCRVTIQVMGDLK